MRTEWLNYHWFAYIFHLKCVIIQCLNLKLVEQQVWIIYLQENMCDLLKCICSIINALSSPWDPCNHRRQPSKCQAMSRATIWRFSEWYASYALDAGESPSPRTTEITSINGMWQGFEDTEGSAHSALRSILSRMAKGKQETIDEGRAAAANRLSIDWTHLSAAPVIDSDALHWHYLPLTNGRLRSSQLKGDSIQTRLISKIEILNRPIMQDNWSFY